MSQKGIVVGLLVISTLFLGGIVAIKSLDKHSGTGQSDNWQWENEWGDSKQHESQEPIEEPIQEEKPMPKDQITATTFEEAVKLSKEHKMPAFIFFEADWCGFCKKMKSDTLGKEKVKDALKNYVFAILDFDENQRIARQKGIDKIPAYFILKSDGTILKRGEGHMSETSFLTWLK